MDIKFEQDDSPWGFRPHRYKCPICGHWRVVHLSSIQKPVTGEGWYCHLTFKCTHCFSTAIHAIPISEEYKEELLRRRNGETIYAPWHQDEFLDEEFTEEEKEEVKRRLKELGYF